MTKVPSSAVPDTPRTAGIKDRSRGRNGEPPRSVRYGPESHRQSDSLPTDRFAEGRGLGTEKGIFLDDDGALLGVGTDHGTSHTNCRLESTIFLWKTGQQDTHSNPLQPGKQGHLHLSRDPVPLDR